MFVNSVVFRFGLCCTLIPFGLLVWVDFDLGGLVGVIGFFRWVCVFDLAIV